MAYKITEKCVACAKCLIECPVGAIEEGEDIEIPEELLHIAGHLDTPVEEQNRYWINPKKCKNHGVCAKVCPVDAIIKVD